MGSTREHLDLCGKISRAAGMAVLSVDYRLAPEHFFPDQVEDCIKSYLWLLEKGLEPSNIIIGGISAGGNLALSAVLNLKAEGVDLPRGIVCMSPAVDLSFPGESVIANQETDWVTPQRLENIPKIYLKDHNPHEAIASPTYGDLKDLPPIFIQYGLNELLKDDIENFCQKLNAHEVQITCQGWENMFHCWQIFSSVLEEGQQAIEETGQYINQLFTA
jgi:acetyl esterase/lipase